MPKNQPADTLQNKGKAKKKQTKLVSSSNKKQKPDLIEYDRFPLLKKPTFVQKDKYTGVNMPVFI
jgi:hypothetical protein